MVACNNITLKLVFEVGIDVLEKNTNLLRKLKIAEKFPLWWIRDLEKLNLVWWLSERLEAISANNKTTSYENVFQFKSD